ncbi:MAG TPA: ADP-ribosylglycohydrolase family protein [Methanoregula sp.]|nr:ADP-ribosylglycohydrolase family protein [Methanoregula sp.]
MRFIREYLHPRGLLAGLAIGDALGAPLEGSPQPEAWLTNMRPGGRHFRNAGQYTDDTLQAMAVAESLVACRGFNQNDLVKRLLSGYKNRPEWYGPTSSAFFELVRSGTVPQRAARLVHLRHHGSRSNGSVMRGFPLGIFYPACQVYDISFECSQLTHYDPAAAHCSAWLNMMAADMCRGISRTRAFCHARSYCRDEEVLAMLGSYKRHHPEPSLDAVLCAHAALFCFMNAHTFENAVLSAINLGGDADTVGACCGALAGAFWGIGSVPERWTLVLEDYTKITKLADALFLGRMDTQKENRQV